MLKQPEKMLELYQFEECPYCQRVRTKLTDLGMSYIIHNVPREREARTELETISGQKFVPVLIDPNTGTTIADDDEKAIRYLEDMYGK
ncbi:MAG: glutaredoxin domain-containing protein [Candidatus Wolfebacteria bacterium]|nr:glutaredoxin domain-containing protein [Candidatus Wolfebacteria bacterium]MDP2704522.1 glutaredoxin domain-containing protein [bacterium]